MSYFILKAGDYAVFIHSEAATDILALQTKLIREGAKPFDLGKGYSAVKHPPHVPGCQYHVHVYLRNDPLFALNQDGTAHDRSHGIQIPNHVKDKLIGKFPEWTIPADGKIAGLEPIGAFEHVLLQKFAGQSEGVQLEGETLLLDLG